MQSILGFMVINVYAFLMIITTCIIFFGKKRMGEIEDETYKYFLISNVCVSLSGLILGILVSPSVVYNEFLVIVFNKFYLISLFLWGIILAFYVYHISISKDSKKGVKVFSYLGIFSILTIILLPISITTGEDGAVALGPSVMFSYLTFAIGYIFEIICVIINRKKMKNKKYIPLYLFIFMGALILIIIMLNPSLNYIINPVLIYIAFVMYHTIENPDVQMNAILVRNNELTERSVNDRSNFLFKVSQEMKKPLEDSLKKIKSYNEKLTKKDTKELISLIENDINNAYFILNDISNISSMDVKKLKVQSNKYSVDKFLKDIEFNTKNKIKNDNRNIDFNFKVNSLTPKYLFGDNIKLKQVLLSIIFNSIKYTKDGFIDVELDSIERYGACRFIFTIRDSGCGMNISKVNELLSLSDGVELSDFEKNDSLELNIPIVIKIIKLLGGSISIKSVEDEGTVVVVVVDQKIADNENNLYENAKKYNLGRQDKRRVLVADDKNQELILSILSKFDVDIVSTVIGHEVNDKINSGDQFDLIILKDELEDKNAYMILKELKENKNFKIPVVLTITKDKEFIKKHFLKDGFDEVVIDDEIGAKLRDVIKKYIG